LVTNGRTARKADLYAYLKLLGLALSISFLSALFESASILGMVAFRSLGTTNLQTISEIIRGISAAKIRQTGGMAYVAQPLPMGVNGFDGF